MHLRNTLGLLLILFLGFSCDSPRTQDEETGTETTVAVPPSASEFEEFYRSFKQVSLPLGLPNADSEKNDTVEISPETISHMYGDARFYFFEEENDVVELQVGSRSAAYFQIGRFETPQYKAVIVQKQTDQTGEDYASYYYLTTFTPDGKYIDGMCIALREKLESDVCERMASINPDYSLQIHQECRDSRGTTRLSKFFEITENGKITDINQPGKVNPI